MVVLDQNMFTTFQTSLSSIKPSSSIANPSQLVTHQTQAPPSQNDIVQVKVYQGNILSSGCEVLVNTTGANYDLTGK